MTRTEYKNRFNQDHYERINFSVPKGTKQVIKELAEAKGMSMNKYFLHLVMKDQEGMFDNMQLAERSREQILSMKGNTHDGYDITLKTGETHHFRTKLEIRKFFSGCLAQDNQSLAQDS